MHKRIMALAVAAVAAAPAGALAAGDAPNAAQTCKTERAAIGVAAFRDLYGTNGTKANAFGKCVSKAHKRADAAEAKAQDACKAEQAADPAAFTAKYGTGKKGKNAFGKCVSQTAKTESEKTEERRVNAAKQCKAQREDDPAAFAEQWGAGRKAYGKCVSTTAKA